MLKFVSQREYRELATDRLCKHRVDIPLVGLTCSKQNSASNVVVFQHLIHCMRLCASGLEVLSHSALSCHSDHAGYRQSRGNTLCSVVLLPPTSAGTLVHPTSVIWSAPPNIYLYRMFFNAVPLFLCDHLFVPLRLMLGPVSIRATSYL